MATTTIEAATIIARHHEEPDKVSYISGGYRLSRPILIGEDAKKTFDSIPSVDVSNVFSPDLEVRKEIAREVAKVAEEVGFFYAINPPVSYEKMGMSIMKLPKEFSGSLEADAALDILKTFFNLPQEDLMALHVDNSQGVKGYLPFKFDDGSKRRASYSIGTDYTNPEQHFVKVAPQGTVPVNQWPDGVLPEFRKVIYEYYHDVFRFARKMLQIFSLALGLGEDALDETFCNPMTDITMQYYPVQPPTENNQSSISAHADYGGFTLLYQDQVGGLEVLNANGVWVPAPPKKHAYVVNTGSYMEVLSNSRFPATVHRASGNAGCERFSLPFFFNPDPASIIVPHPELLAKGQESKFEPQHVSRRTVKGVMNNRPNHPFLRKLKALGLREDELTYDLLSRPIESIAAK